MSTVEIVITPNIAEPGSSGLVDDNYRLQFEEFLEKNELYEITFRFGKYSASYGICTLFDYYADICQELYSMLQGLDHDIEMSGYPVGSVAFTQGDNLDIIVFGADGSGKPADYDEVVSRTEFIEELRRVKAIIEKYIRANN